MHESQSQNSPTSLQEQADACCHIDPQQCAVCISITGNTNGAMCPTPMEQCAQQPLPLRPTKLGWLLTVCPGLVDTIYVGRLGSMQLAGVGIALSVFNTATRLLNTPLLSVANSAVAAAVGREQQRKQAEQRLDDAIHEHAMASIAYDAASDADTRSKVSELAVNSSGNSTSSLNSSLNSSSNSSSISSSASDSSKGGSDNGSLGTSNNSTSSESSGRVLSAAAAELAVDEVSLVASSVLGVACIAGIVQVG